MKTKQYCTRCDTVSTKDNKVCPNCGADSTSLIPVDDAGLHNKDNFMLKHIAMIKQALELEGKILVARQFNKWVGFQKQLDPTYEPTINTLETWLFDNGYWTGKDSKVESNYLQSIWDLVEEQAVLV